MESENHFGAPSTRIIAEKLASRALEVKTISSVKAESLVSSLRLSQKAIERLGKLIAVVRLTSDVHQVGFTQPDLPIGFNQPYPPRTKGE